MGWAAEKARHTERLGRRIRAFGFAVCCVVLLVFLGNAASKADLHWGGSCSAPSDPGSIPSVTSSPAQLPGTTYSAPVSASPTASGSAAAPGAQPQQPGAAQPTAFLPATPASGPDNTAEIIKAVAYLVGAVGGAAAAIVGQIVMLRGIRGQSRD
ncbi:hypothetical protein [Streptomyces sp. NPDC059009]|uniref:hypothetical protein n=1 Tax=Streptomyces sp. NPDC059009 TaxID=3346694 RepID=UPI0036D08DBA